MVRFCNNSTILTIQTAVPLVPCPKQTLTADDVQAAYHGLRHRKIQKHTVKSFIIPIPRNIRHWVDQNCVTKVWGSFNTTGGMRRIQNISRKTWKVGSITANTKVRNEAVNWIQLAHDRVQRERRNSLIGGRRPFQDGLWCWWWWCEQQQPRQPQV